MLGFPDQQSLLLINAVEGYLVPDVREQWQNQMAREEVVRDFQAQVRRQDGTAIWLQNIGRIIRDDLGQPLYYEGSVEDITKRKQAEAALAATALENARLYDEIRRHANELEQRVQLRTAELNRAKDHVEAIFNNSSDVIILTGTDGTVH